MTMNYGTLHVKCFVCNMVEENTYVLWDDTHEAVIVDCGAFYDREKQDLADFVEREGLVLKHLLNTHGHFDHIFGNQFIREQYDLLPELSWDETDTYLVAAEQMRMFMHREIPLDVPPIGNTLVENDEVRFGAHRLKVIATPGHTAGGICFYCEEEGVLLSGDSLFRSCIGRCDLPGGNEQLLVRGLKEKVLTLPENVVVLPGHGPSTTVLREKQGNPYLY